MIYNKIVFLFISLFLVSCSLFDNSHDVKYEVSGTAKKVFITFENNTGGTSQLTSSVPWTKSFSAEPSDFVYISAQNQGATGVVVVSIYKDGKLFKSATSSGGYSIASASGTL